MDTPSDADIEALFDHYFAHGCPCRFPRFRATVARDLKEIGAWDWGVSDAWMLLAVFDRRVPLVEKTREDFAVRGRCELCGAGVNRFGIPVFRDSFLERANITPGDLPDVGADASGPVPVCGHVFHAAPGNVSRSEQESMQNAYPRLKPETWLAYMRALAAPPASD
jgi:hypothetical protein